MGSGSGFAVSCIIFIHRATVRDSVTTTTSVRARLGLVSIVNSTALRAALFFRLPQSLNAPAVQAGVAGWNGEERRPTHQRSLGHSLVSACFAVFNWLLICQAMIAYGHLARQRSQPFTRKEGTRSTQKGPRNAISCAFIRLYKLGTNVWSPCGLSVPSPLRDVIILKKKLASTL
jgi:hypothetical protein